MILTIVNKKKSYGAGFSVFRANTTELHSLLTIAPIINYQNKPETVGHNKSGKAISSPLAYFIISTGMQLDINLIVPCSQILLSYLSMNRKKITV